MLDQSVVPDGEKPGGYIHVGGACALEPFGVISTASKMAAVQMTRVGAIALFVIISRSIRFYGSQPRTMA